MDSKLILIIDDDQWTCNVLKKFLTHNLIVFEDAQCAANGIIAAVNLKPNLIMLDIIMPDMNGLDVLKTLKGMEITKEIPIILVSGNIDLNTIKIANSMNVSHFISKPYQKETIIEKVHSLLWPDSNESNT